MHDCVLLPMASGFLELFHPRVCIDGDYTYMFSQITEDELSYMSSKTHPGCLSQ